MCPHVDAAIPRRTWTLALTTALIALLLASFPAAPARATAPAQGGQPPEVSFYWVPSEPSTLSTIRFYAYIYDPYPLGIASYAWDFGDGTPVSSAAEPTHQYADPGAYFISLTATTADGRSATAVRELTVVAPRPPYANISWYPDYSPSTYDQMRIYFNTVDPEDIGIASCAIDLGDGATAVCGSFPYYDISHQYAADGDYTITVRLATADGRAGETSRVISIRTHDVSISKLTVPQSARVGQTRPIVVGVSNQRYAEQVVVVLLKSDPQGYWTEVGRSTQYVPVRSGNRTTNFSFNYTFTAEDARIGKVTFKAYASILGSDPWNTTRDAAPGDNEVIGLPTRVTAR